MRRSIIGRSRRLFSSSSTCVVYALEVTLPGFAQQLVLEHGNGLHPAQWLTSHFAHADMMHLVGNMAFLWSFGLIVEGKLGWWKTLVTYLGVGIVHGAFTQLVMLGASGRRLPRGVGSRVRPDGHDPRLSARERPDVFPGRFLRSLRTRVSDGIPDSHFRWAVPVGPGRGARRHRRGHEFPSSFTPRAPRSAFPSPFGC